MSDLRDLYQQVIIDHAKKPRNFGELEAADRTIEGYNPLCGDKFQVQVAFDGERIGAVRFTGSGCAISTASASLMTDAMKGLSVSEGEAIVSRFLAMVTAPTDSGVESNGLGKLAILSGVREFPSRIKCATLAWHSLRAALKGEAAVVSTE